MLDTKCKEFAGEDVDGNTFFVFTDKSPKDFWIETFIMIDRVGKITVRSCDIIYNIPKSEERKEDGI